MKPEVCSYFLGVVGWWGGGGIISVEELASRRIGYINHPIDESAGEE